MRKNKKKHSTQLSKSEHARETHPSYKDGSGTKVLTPEILLAGIFVLALFIRLLYLNQIISTPIFHGLVVDAEKYDNFALKILAGNLTHKEFIYLNPLYPFFLALIYLIFGHSHLSVVLTQAAIDSLSCMLIYYIAEKLFNKVVGIMAAVTYACYGLTIFYTGTILAPTLVIFLSLSFISSLLAAQEKRNPLIFSISGRPIAFAAHIPFDHVGLPSVFKFHLYTSQFLAMPQDVLSAHAFRENVEQGKSQGLDNGRFSIAVPAGYTIYARKEIDDLLGIRFNIF